jgi:hypothetical protein
MAVNASDKDPKGAAKKAKPAASAPAAAAAPSAPDNSASAGAGAAASAQAGPSLLERLSPWLVPIYVASLALVFAGERVFSTIDAARYGFTLLGVAGAVFATIARFAVAGRMTGERRAVERTLAVFSLVGLVGLAVYFATTDAGRDLLGISRAEPVLRARIDTATLIGWVVLIILALLPLLLGEAALGPMRRAPRVEIRRVRAATLSGLTLALAVTYSTLFTYAAGELDLKADFSYYRTARASESTRSIAASLNEPLKVMAFFPQLNDVGVEVEGYLRDAARGAPNFQVEVYDRLLVPAIAKDAKVLQDGVVVLSRGSSRESLTIGTDMKSAAAKLKSLDTDFQKSLLKVIREQRTAYITVSHGELNESAGGAAAEGKSAKGIRKLLESQNYVVKDLGLAQGLGSEIPKDAFLVVVLGPQRAFLPEEVAALTRYAERGGKLFLALDPDPRAELAPLAGAVDLTWDPVILATEKNLVMRRHNSSDRTILVTTRFSSHASVSTLSKNAQRAPIILPGVSTLDKKAGTDAKIDFVVRSLGDAFLDANGNFEQDKDAEKQGTYNLAAAVTKPASGDAGGAANAKDKPEMRAFVVADADVLSDGFLGHEPNLIFVLDALRWLGGEESFSGAVASNEDVRIEHTKQKDLLWFYATIFGAPAVVLGAGLVLTRRARRRAAGRSA